MKNPLALATLAACATLGLAPVVSAQPATHLGRWITESGNLEIEVAPCGKALCGTVVRVLANRSMSGPGTDMAAADARPALGMTILSDLHASGENEWKGQIYNRENAKYYSAQMSLGGPGELVIRAYVGLPLFGKTQVWRRPGEAPVQEAAK